MTESVAVDPVGDVELGVVGGEGEAVGSEPTRDALADVGRAVSMPVISTTFWSLRRTTYAVRAAAVDDHLPGLAADRGARRPASASGWPSL